MKFSQKIVFYVVLALTSFSVSYLTCEFTFRDTKANSTEIIEVTPKADTYKVMEFGGKIAVFLNDEKVPCYTLASPFVRDLPEFDRDLLKKGIIVNSKEELVKILEDYDG